MHSQVLVGAPRPGPPADRFFARQAATAVVAGKGFAHTQVTGGTNIATPRAIALTKMADDFFIALAPLKSIAVSQSGAEPHYDEAQNFLLAERTARTCGSAVSHLTLFHDNP